MTYHSARDRLLAAAGYPGPSNVEFFEALSDFEQCVRLEERRAEERLEPRPEVKRRRANG